MDTKDQFYTAIYYYYKNMANDNISDKTIKDLCIELGNHFFDEYSRFRKQYPKSAKRYSSFQIKDLNHPLTFEFIIKFFKTIQGSDYKKNSCRLLNMTKLELDDFEKKRQEFYNMF